LLTRPGRNIKRESQKVNNIILFPELTYSIPPIGIGQSTRKETLTENEITLLRKVPFDHYRIDLYLFEKSWEAKAGRGLIECRELGYPAELALFFDENAEKEAADFIKWSNSAKEIFAIIHLFHRICQSSPDWLIEKVVPKLRKHLPHTALSCGTNSNFAQLNRNRINSDKADIVSYSIHPQEHASDNLTIIENIDAQKYTVESAIKLFPGKKIWISPVTIQRRFNANIENFEKCQVGSQLPAQVDCRLMSLLGAAWTAGSLKKIVCAGAGGITFYETAGERGIIQGDYPTRWPEIFFAANGMIFPSFFIFKYILGNKTFRILKSESDAPLKIDQIILSDGLKIKMIIVNYTIDKHQVIVPANITKLTIQQLHEGNFSNAVSDENWIGSDADKSFCLTDHLWLEPYSVSFVDGEIKLR
jgi:D-apionolactonase